MIPRMRTINQCLDEIKRMDSDTAITEWFIRSLIYGKRIKYFASGNKSLVNLDDLLRYLNGEVA